ncbi:hypothetical protein YC2023_094587 [Brassica napus]
MALHGSAFGFLCVMVLVGLWNYYTDLADLVILQHKHNDLFLCASLSSLLPLINVQVL